MTMHDIASAMQRTEAALRRRPQLGLHDNEPATARWTEGLRMVTSHANGASVPTDMPSELGGSGDQVSPSWLFRAGLASCAATSIAMAAAAQEIELTALEVKVISRSDVRGLLGMTDANGEAVFAGPCDVQLHVRIAARDASRESLRSLVEDSQRCSPIPAVARHAVPVAVSVHFDIE